MPSCPEQSELQAIMLSCGNLGDAVNTVANALDAPPVHELVYGAAPHARLECLHTSNEAVLVKRYLAQSIDMCNYLFHANSLTYYKCFDKIDY